MAVEPPRCHRGPLYLVKWQGYGFDECTWEPLQHLPEEVIEEFNNPTVTEESIDFHSKMLEEVIRKRLKSRNKVFLVTFPSELYRFVFGTTSEKLAEKEDFGRLNLREHWDTTFRNNGVGIRLKFPVRLSHVIRNKDDFVLVNGVLKKQKNLVERLRITSSTGVVFCSLH
ncbi:unnamed protein product [Mytilus coruscus]|uniref:Chromo domain-containing protein n=1 Tax=Mytilus coruscus TaxID=42192 RepID=A0A6J8DS01_MYTCO|nr:unnamed protein product [Mytilus coruscus]